MHGIVNEISEIFLIILWLDKEILNIKAEIEAINRGKFVNKETQTDMLNVNTNANLHTDSAILQPNSRHNNITIINIQKDNENNNSRYINYDGAGQKNNIIGSQRDIDSQKIRQNNDTSNIFLVRK